MMRAQRLLASLTGLSRRAAEALIAQGRLETAPGVPVALGASLPPGAPLLLDGRAVAGSGAAAPPPPVYLALHKPPRVLSAWTPQRAAAEPAAAHAAAAAATLTDVLARAPPPGAPALARLLHVGRLDFDSEGLLLLTSDGVWAHGVAHPSAGARKRYLLACAPGGGGAGRALPQRALLQALLAGVALAGEARPARAAEARVLGLREAQAAFECCAAPLQGGSGQQQQLLLHVTLAGEGRQRVLRRMLAACGYGVARLMRVGVGGVQLGALRAGQCRALTEVEVAGLRAGTAAGAVGVVQPKAA
jgi:23S rRNA pseudouridine2605 synthase